MRGYFFCSTYYIWIVHCVRLFCVYIYGVFSVREILCITYIRYDSWVRWYFCITFIFGMISIWGYFECTHLVWSPWEVIFVYCRYICNDLCVRIVCGIHMCDPYVNLFCVSHGLITVWKLVLYYTWFDLHMKNLCMLFNRFAFCVNQYLSLVWIF